VSTSTTTLGASEPKGGGSNRLSGGFHRLYYGQTKFDFVRRRRIWFAASAIVILAGALSLAVRGLNFDIEFAGGTSWQVPANGVTVSEARTAITPLGLGGATITILGSGKNQQIQVEAKVSESSSALRSQNAKTASSAQDAVSKALATVTHHQSIKAVTVQEVGPTWGSQITHKAVVALIVFVILIALYISLFFEWKMALAAILAVMHDIVVTVGIYSLTGFLVTPDTVVAFLTILGYSLYDTIVVFDRIRDNTKGLGSSGKLTFTDVVNLSMNQTLARSINTSLVAILPILAVLVLGADVLGATTLQYFGLALLIGLASGAYSSIFIASPLVAMLKEREPRYVQIRQRLEARGAAMLLLTPEQVASGALADQSERASGGARRRRRQPSSGSGVSTGPLRPGSGRAAAPGAEVAPAPEESEESVTGEDAGSGSAAAGSSAKASGGRNGAAQRPGGTARPGAGRPGAGQPRPRKKRRR
jgi:preprotein translocase subunit SecF